MAESIFSKNAGAQPKINNHGYPRETFRKISRNYSLETYAH